MQNTALNQLFAKEAKQRIFETNQYLEKIQNVSEYLNYRTVNIPNYTTSAATVVINGTSFDYNNFTQTIEQFVTFNIDNFRIPTIHVEDFEQMVTNYDKFQLVTREKIAELTDQVSKRILWSLSSDVDMSTRSISTTGSAGTNNNADGTSNKKKFTFNDLINLGALMNGDNIPDDGKRCIIIDHIENAELLQDPQVISYMQFGKAVAEAGSVGKVAGFNIYVKPTIATASTSGTVNTWGHTPSTGDIRLALAFHPDFLVRAQSEVKVYTQAGIPQLYGSALSGEIDMGVKNPRTDKKGVYLVKQG